MLEMAVSIQEAGEDRGRRIYFDTRDLQEIKKICGDDFFLLTQRKLLAVVDPEVETITITPLRAVARVTRTGGEERPEQAPLSQALDFYMPIAGTGEMRWIGMVSAMGKVAYYCVASSMQELLEEVHSKGDKHFPGLLNLSGAVIKHTQENVVYSPVPSHIAQKTYKSIGHKEVCGIKIPCEVSVPMDVELCPVVDVGEGSIKEFEIKRREILAKYEITAIASRTSNVRDARIQEENGKLLWAISADDGEAKFDAVTGERV
jgi:hypothetical protein